MKSLYSIGFVIICISTFSCSFLGLFETIVLNPSPIIYKIRVYETFYKTKNDVTLNDDSNIYAITDSIAFIINNLSFTFYSTKTKQIIDSYNLYPTLLLPPPRGLSINSTPYLTDITFNQKQNQVFLAFNTGLLACYSLSERNWIWTLKVDTKVNCIEFDEINNYILVGTEFNEPDPDSNKSYYSSLFAISSIDGNFVKHFKDYYALKELHLQINNNFLAVYDWPAHDAFLWSNESNTILHKYPLFFTPSSVSIQNDFFLCANWDGLYKVPYDGTKPELFSDLFNVKLSSIKATELGIYCLSDSILYIITNNLENTVMVNLPFSMSSFSTSNTGKTVFFSRRNTVSKFKETEGTYYLDLESKSIYKYNF